MLKKEKKKLKIQRNFFKLEIKDIWTLFETEEEKKKEKSQRKKEINNRLIKDKLIKDIMMFLNNQKKIIISLKEKVIFGTIILLNMKVMVIKIETYHQTNILTKLNLT